jgi:YD repeat-containing protein
VAGQRVGCYHADGSTNAWRYDLAGRLIKEVLPNGSYWQTVYDDANRRVSRTFKNLSDVTLATSFTQLDTRGNVIQRSDLEGNVFTKAFDGLDRVKVAAGPVIATVSLDWDMVHYHTNNSRQLTAYAYDAFGQTVTATNVLGEKIVTTSDALGRPTQVAFYASNSVTPLRVTATSYSPDHQSVTVTQGTGAGAIRTTTYCDNDGHPVLTARNPQPSAATEYTWRQYDRGGNCLAENQCSINGRAVTVWQTNGWTYDGLNRVVAETNRDGVFTLYNRDALGNVTNRTMPSGLAWSATYNNDGRIVTEQETGGGLTSRSMTCQYYPAGSPFAGLLQTATDGRGTTRSNIYEMNLTRQP